MAIDISILIATIGGFVGLSGYIISRDKKLSRDAEWKGEVNAKLDAIIAIKATQERAEMDLGRVRERLALAEAAAERAHSRLDALGAPGESWRRSAGKGETH